MNKIDKQKEKIKKVCQYKTLNYSRLMVYVKNIGYFYDIGLRCIEDPFDLLSTTVQQNKDQCTVFGIQSHPRFFEDFVEYYGKNMVKAFTSLTFDQEDVTKELLDAINKLEEMKKNESV